MAGTVLASKVLNFATLRHKTQGHAHLGLHERGDGTTDVQFATLQAPFLVFVHQSPLGEVFRLLDHQVLGAQMQADASERGIAPDLPPTTRMSMKPAAAMTRTMGFGTVGAFNDERVGGKEACSRSVVLSFASRVVVLNNRVSEDHYASDITSSVSRFTLVCTPEIRLIKAILLYKCSLLTALNYPILLYIQRTH